MNRDEIKALFDQQAAGYDAQWAKTLPMSASMAASRSCGCTGTGWGPGATCSAQLIRLLPGFLQRLADAG